MMTKKLWWFIKVMSGFGTITDGSICYVAEHYGVDCHDYPVDKGGIGHPWHLIEFTCPKCGRKFYI